MAGSAWMRSLGKVSQVTSARSMALKICHVECFSFVSGRGAT
ncbi:hypothetical protein ID866_8146 [Astraeus odoratus]|nr:hypothetical protein ID866_8146 [Astraeus odoratus]